MNRSIIIAATFGVVVFSGAIWEAWPPPLSWHKEFQAGESIPQWVVGYPENQIIGTFGGAVTVTWRTDGFHKDVTVKPSSSASIPYVLGFVCKIPGCGDYHLTGKPTLVENFDFGGAMSAVSVAP